MDDPTLEIMTFRTMRSTASFVETGWGMMRFLSQ
jgi:hypothetical protein